MTFVESIAFHTASLRWLVSEFTNSGDININGTYKIALNATNVTFSVPIAESMGKREYELRLQGLAVGVQYHYTISVFANDRSIEGAAQGTFRTPGYRKLNQYVHRERGRDAAPKIIGCCWDYLIPQKLFSRQNKRLPNNSILWRKPPKALHTA